MLVVTDKKEKEKQTNKIKKQFDTSESALLKLQNKKDDCYLSFVTKGTQKE